MDRQNVKKNLIRFLATIKKPDMSMDRVRDDDLLVQSGLIDSLAMLEIISYLESEHAVDFSETGVDPVQLESIDAILDLIEKQAK